MRALVATFLFRALLSGLLLPAVGFAGPSAQTATGQDLVWDREIALLAANQADAGTAAEQLVELARNAKRTETLRALRQLASRTDWTEPARESALLLFTEKLRTLPPFSIDSTVLAFLLDYPNRVLVAHDDAPGLAVPLFPIRATAAGLVHQWTRQQAELDARDLLRENPEKLVEVYAASRDQNIRAGIESAAGQADERALRILLNAGMPLLPDNPGLTGLMGVTALRIGDPQLAARVFADGSGAALVEMSRQASQQLSGAQLGKLMLETLNRAPAGTAALVIAELAPHSLGQAGVDEALLQKLKDPELGSAIALTFVQWGTDRQLQALEAAASADPSGLAAKRVRSALSTGRRSRDGGALQ